MKLLKPSTMMLTTCPLVRASSISSVAVDPICSSAARQVPATSSQSVTTYRLESYVGVSVKVKLPSLGAVNW